jgi:hypothetical protein|tara:strand:- start:346 stop:489 length:144 start_codon:yes stop_codon:yes gene_type:complete
MKLVKKKPMLNPTRIAEPTEAQVEAELQIDLANIAKWKSNMKRTSNG